MHTRSADERANVAWVECLSALSADGNPISGPARELIEPILAAAIRDAENAMKSRCAAVADAAAQPPSLPTEYAAERSTDHGALRKAREIAAAIRALP